MSDNNVKLKVGATFEYFNYVYEVLEIKDEIVMLGCLGFIFKVSVHDEMLAGFE